MPLPLVIYIVGVFITLTVLLVLNRYTKTITKDTTIEESHIVLVSFCLLIWPLTLLVVSIYCFLPKEK